MMQYLVPLSNINPMYAIWAENALFNRAQKFADGYSGGYWEPFVSGEFAFPTFPEPEVRLSNPDNLCDMTMDARSAGVALWLLTVNHLAWAIAEGQVPGTQAMMEKVCDLFYRLRDAALDNKELNARAILSFID